MDSPAGGTITHRAGNITTLTLASKDGSNGGTFDLRAGITIGTLTVGPGCGRWMWVAWETVESLLDYQDEEDGKQYPAAYVLQRAERYGIEGFRWCLKFDGELTDGTGDVQLDRDDVEDDLHRHIRRNKRNDPRAVEALAAKGVTA